MRDTSLTPYLTLQLVADVHRLPGETVAHSLLSSHGLAPPLLARFENGLLYRFIEGSVCSPADLRRPMVWRGVAKRLGQWHATVPASSLSSGPTGNGHRVAQDAEQVSRETNGDTGGRMPATLTPNLWTVSQRWLQVLPSKTAAEKSRNANLQRELEWLARRLESARGVDGLQFVFSHCDLLHGNVIVLPDAKPARSASSSSSDSDGSAGSKSDHHRHRNLHRRRQHHHHQHPSCEVSFIDYEYCTPAPAAFDIANHFAEWGGFECDYSVLPTRLQRRDFLAHYLSSYNEHLGRSPGAVAAAAAAGTTAAEGAAEDEYERELDRLSEQVDAFRGVPGFYWGLWAHIQASISQIDFDYAGYAQIRLAEYWDWKAELLGEREAGGREMPLRERRWAQDE